MFFFVKSSSRKHNALRIVNGDEIILAANNLPASPAPRMMIDLRSSSKRKSIVLKKYLAPKVKGTSRETEAITRRIGRENLPVYRKSTSSSNVSSQALRTDEVSSHSVQFLKP